MQLRDICRDHAHLTAPYNAGSMARILVHIANINRAVLASTQHHVNASKRLHDFAVTLDRIARHFAPQDGHLAMRMTNVSKALKAVGEDLAENDVVPGWKSPVVCG
jgi:tRNA A22 N-methylase